MPVIVGSALAQRNSRFDFPRFILVLIACVLVQIFTNLVDEYSDHARPEGREKLLAPYKVIARGLLTSAEVKKGANVCLAIATAIGIYLTFYAGWPIAVMCLASAAAAYFYSAGPRPWGKIGLGQPLVFIFMGIVMVMGSYYVQAGRFTLDAFLLALPVAFTVTAILAANDIRDSEEDRVSGKRTVATIWGQQVAWWEYLALIAAAFLIVISLVITRRMGLTTIVSLLALPQAAMALSKYRRGGNRVELALVLPATSRLHLHFGVLLALGVILQGVVH